MCAGAAPWETRRTDDVLGHVRHCKGQGGETPAVKQSAFGRFFPMLCGGISRGLLAGWPHVTYCRSIQFQFTVST